MSELPLRRHTTTACPFVYCLATVEVAHEMKAPGPSGGAVRRVKTHSIESDVPEWSGTPCPASLMVLPINDAGQAALDEYERLMNAARDRRERDAEDAARRRDDGPGRPQPPHGRTPQPDADPKWFRQGPGSSSRHSPPLLGLDSITRWFRDDDGGAPGAGRPDER